LIKYSDIRSCRENNRHHSWGVGRVAALPWCAARRIVLPFAKNHPMPNSRHRYPPPLLPLLALSLAGLAGCATAPAGALAEDGDRDPLIGWNRAVFRFNETADRWVIKPAAQGYDYVLPQPVQNAVSRFFANLDGPTVLINDLLQGKFKQSAADTGRFLINSTLGIAGLFDVAKPLGLPPNNEDFGQTLAVWGVGSGIYVVWPIVGPRDLRDSFGLLVDFATDPITYVDDPAVRWSAWALELVDTRANLLGAGDVLEQAGGDDKYLFLREAYRQRRHSLTHDGNPPRPKFFDDDDAIVMPPSP